MSNLEKQVDYEKISPFIVFFTKVLGVNKALRLHRAICNDSPDHRTMLREALRQAKASGVAF